ncbi:MULTISPECIES: carboxymuconolactone decarboxylase family protein [Mycolicibacterium]|uniref:4-carboxymuconolactone decarboxylase n=4 Tax=Mycolicibacterium TaxID=1866885 RepID=A0R5Z5_MYCS2|nr:MULTISPECIES: carboxymuconolactone decarboxylase family protein [Mycolicibacterium]OKH70428.1 4-carboxymuconolactone decarboxylase [Mycobacterium sp. SWH-M5]ABK73494.1 4-carboxymuconolactone decarboxylase [Mycolicibacterium smegmatis MC2 155]AFP42628.1 Alkylhydroperoxidase AhpD core [Mycolicibacterium smegmatis MC2 155]AIU11351.1 4-carboxymuconolactone decarboxylase [Mycolicibacterium smegmatis MC2 155]AIU17975.1 4-carboxymuconolactone decarboxylase [Mycolicibacterium smegmatis]
MTQTLESTERVKIYKAFPEFYDAMMNLSATSAKDFDHTIGELVKIRASQINRCGFCLDMHARDARKQGETEQRLALIAAWEEAGDLFTEREQAALALTEAVTEINRGPVSDDVYERAAAVFSERELSQLIAMIVTINAWNRINVTVKMPFPRR